MQVSSRRLRLVGIAATTLALSMGIGTALAVPAEGAAPVSADNPLVTFHATTGGTLENREIAAHWRVVNGHLSGLAIENKMADRGLKLNPAAG